MVKRLFWLVLGFGLGVGATVRATRTVRRAIERSLPPAAVDRVRDLNTALEERAVLIRARNPRRNS